MTSFVTAPTASTSKPAQMRSLPSQPFYSVEYPGYLQSSSSVSEAIRMLGGQKCLDNALGRGKKNGERENVVDLSLRPDNPFSHPVSGDVISNSNLLLKVVKRKRKQPTHDGLVGEYTAEVVGSIPKTIRFRSMLLY
ncbi:MAG TPA: hypothetical protein VGO47_11785 [Chlamydiales bacterium]|nr:hypothetical protein [Chlamydiales bacterium]